MTFDLDGKTYEVRLLKIKDDDVVEDILRKRRLAGCTNMQGADVIAKVISEPISEQQIWDFKRSNRGLAYLFKSCITSKDRLTDAVIEKFVIDGNPIILRWWSESNPKAQASEVSV